MSPLPVLRLNTRIGGSDSTRASVTLLSSIRLSQ